MPKPWGQPNKSATGVLNAQGRVNTRDLGQIGGTGSEDLAFGDAAFGGTIEDGVITLQTDGAVDFGTKAQPKPLLVWRADDGEAPNADLGQSAGWGAQADELTVARGELTQTNAGPGGTRSIVFDHNVEDRTALSRIYFYSDKLYLFRRRYDEFTPNENRSIRTRIAKDSMTGDLPQPGDTVTGGSSGATGVFQGLVERSANYEFFYEPAGGSVNDQPPTEFEWDESMSWPGGSGTNNEGSAEFPTGTLTSFNNKTIRFHSEDPNVNLYQSESREGETGNTQFTVERADGPTIQSTSYDNMLEQRDRVWTGDEFVYQTSDIDATNGIMWWYRDGVKAFEDHRFNFRTAERPNKFTWIAQGELSNGAQPGTNRYYDLIYVSETWSRVVLMDGPDIQLDLNEGSAFERKTLPLPPSLWQGDKIEVADMRNYLPTATHIGVINDQNELIASTEIS